MLTVYGRKSSFNLQKVMWLVAELGLPHEHIELGGRFGGLDSAAFRAMNPHGKVPVIDDDGIVVWESQAILRYLAATYGGPDWWATDAAERSVVDRWMDWSQTTLQPDFLNGVFWRYYRTPEPQRDMAAVSASLSRTAAHLGRVDELIGDKPYLLGEALSLADIVIGTHLYRYYELDIDRPALPNVERWYAALIQRPAYREQVMVPFADLFGRLDY